AEHAELAAAAALREAELARLQVAHDELADTLAGDIARGDVTLRNENGLLAVDLADQILFPPGSAELSERGREVIRRVAPSLARVEGRIVEVGGHTDDRNLSGESLERFPTNWELSTARASNVVRFLQEECELAGERLVAAGFSAYRPAASNRSARGRSRNRRIELTLRPPPPSRRLRR
ncbi:MAG: OmpA family protein, partial [Myxococcales bacterium]|nr:OmpA family protein [Myxococcales bacterium]